MLTVIMLLVDLCMEFVQALESFGRLWKLIMPFSKTWKMLENEGFFKLTME